MNKLVQKFTFLLGKKS